MVSTIARAQTGIEASTGTICMSDGEAFTADAVAKRVDNLPMGTLTFYCLGDSAVCAGTNPDLTIDSDSITANTDTQFQATIKCSMRGDRKYSCTARIS